MREISMPASWGILTIVLLLTVAFLAGGYVLSTEVGHEIKPLALSVAALIIALVAAVASTFGLRFRRR